MPVVEGRDHQGRRGQCGEVGRCAEGAVAADGGCGGDTGRVAPRGCTALSICNSGADPARVVMGAIRRAIDKSVATDQPFGTDGRSAAAVHNTHGGGDRTAEVDCNRDQLGMPIDTPAECGEVPTQNLLGVAPAEGFGVAVAKRVKTGTISLSPGQIGADARQTRRSWPDVQPEAFTLSWQPDRSGRSKVTSKVAAGGCVSRSEARRVPVADHRCQVFSRRGTGSAGEPSRGYSMVKCNPSSSQ